MANYRKYTAVRQDHIDMIVTDNPRVWMVRLRDFSGNTGEFEGGEYILEVRAPADYPFRPPEFYFKTPNGVYDVDKKVCISIGEFHTNSWPAAKGMGGMVVELVNGLISWRELGWGIALLKTSPERKRELAIASREWNRRRYPALVEQFDGLPHNVLYRASAELPISERSLFLLRRWLALVE